MTGRGSFTHLHVHTEYSMLDGAARIGEVVGAAVADGQPAIGITDHGNMYGILDFYKECRKQGIKPILGTEAYMAHDSRHERPARRGRVDDSGGDADGGKKLYYHLTLLAEDNTGYRNLIQLASRAFMEGYYYKPRVDWETLSDHASGLIATTGCLGGHVLQSLMQGDVEGATAKAARLQDIFGKDNLFVELQDHGIPEQHKTNPQLLDLAKRIGAPLLATNDSHYVHRDHAVAHDALLCVQTGSLMSDPNRFKFHGDEHYLKTAAEMRSLFGEVPESCDNSLWIAERCDVEIDFGKPQLPNFPLPEGFETDGDYLRHLTFEGARERWGEQLPDAAVERLAYELKVIEDMGFSSYFLIVWDLIAHARRSGIRVGPGTGERGGLRGGLHAAHHRPRPHQVRPAVRAVPQPVAHLDARHRHGLRLPLPGRDDPLRGRALRPRPRRPDRHVLDHQGPGRGARRRPGARPPVHRRRQGGQGHAAADHGS